MTKSYDESIYYFKLPTKLSKYKLCFKHFVCYKKVLIEY